MTGLFFICTWMEGHQNVRAVGNTGTKTKYWEKEKANQLYTVVKTTALRFHEITHQIQFKRQIVFPCKKEKSSIQSHI